MGNDDFRTVLFLGEVVETNQKDPEKVDDEKNKSSESVRVGRGGAVGVGPVAGTSHGPGRGH